MTTHPEKELLHSLAKVPCERTAEEKAQNLTRAIILACDTSMVKKTNPRRQRPVYWWTKEIAEILKAAQDNHQDSEEEMLAGFM